ncbi:MAG: type II secretion system protein GspC [Woeseiaceae bacterium]
MDGPKTLATASQLLPGWISLILVVLIGWQLAQLVWSLVPAPAAGDAVVTPSAVSQTSTEDSGGLDVNAISAAHIFGIASAEDEAPPPAPEEYEDLRDTRLSNLALKGTIAADPADLAVAIISDGGNKEQVYTIGSPVTNGAKLHSVYADRVVLDENGVLTNLKLPKDFPAGAPRPTRRDTTASIRPAATNTQSIQKVVAQNVSQLSDVIRPTPYFVDGQQQGYRVYPGRNRAQFTALGLRPGDLVKDIDGQSLSDPTQAMKIFETLGDSSEVSVTVERNGQPEVIVLRTDQLDIADETQ